MLKNLIKGKNLLKNHNFEGSKDEKASMSGKGLSLKPVKPNMYFNEWVLLLIPLYL